VKWWDAPNKQNPKLEVSVLKTLLSDKTKLVCCTHTSNILGTISDIKSIAEAVHAVPGALLCVDAVAYAPHRQVDMRHLDVDFYCFSWYKVYGPHIAMLYAKQSSQNSMQSLGHYFKGSASLEDKLGLAAANYELTASIPEVCEYLSQIPWDAISAHEEKLQGILIDYLNSRKDVKIWGEPVKDAAKRVPVISWTVDGRSSKDVVDAVEAKSDFGFRWGAFYSNRLVQEVMGLDPVDGVIRVSLVHYNTGKFVGHGDHLTLELTKPQRTRLRNSSKCWMRYSPTRLLNTYDTTLSKCVCKLRDIKMQERSDPEATHAFQTKLLEFCQTMYQCFAISPKMAVRVFMQSCI